MADGNYIEITARLDKGASIDMIQKDLFTVAKKVLLQLHHVEVSQAGTKSLQASINDIQKNLKVNISGVAIDQNQMVQEAQQVAKQISSTMSTSLNRVDTSGLTRATEQIQSLKDALDNSGSPKAFTDLDELQNFVRNTLPQFENIKVAINSWYEGTETVTGQVKSFTAEILNGDKAVEKLSFRLKGLKDDKTETQWVFSNASATDNAIKVREQAIKLQEQLEKQTIKASDASFKLSNNLESVRQKFAEIAQAHNGDANIANYLDNAVKAINALNGADSSNFNKLKINAENAIQEYTNYLNKLKTTDAQNIRLQEQLEKQVAKSSNASLKLSNNLEGAKKKLSEVLQNHGNDANITRYLENAVQAINTLNKADGSNFDRLKINAENAIRTYTDYLNKLKTADTQAEQAQRRLDAQLVSTQKTLDHNIMILGNLSKNSIFGKNATSPEVVEMQANVDKLRESYQNLKTNTTDSIASPELVGKFKELNVQIVDTIVNSQKLAKTLGDKTTNVVPEVELNNLKTLMNNLKASDVEVDRLKADYGELVGLMIQAQDTGDWSNYLKQLSIFKSKFTEAKSEVRATTAATSDLARMAKSLTSNKMNTFFDKNSDNAQVNALKTEINGLINEWTALNAEIETTGHVTHSMQGRLDELRVKMQNATTAADTLQKNIKEVANAQRLATQKQSLDTRITSWLQNNTRASQETIATLKEMQAQIQNADHQTMANLNNQFRQVTANARAAGEAGMKLGDVVKQKLGKFAGWFSIATVVMRSVNELKNMYREVVELDTALVDLRKTTDATNAQLEDFYFEANKIGKQLGVTTKDVIQATSEWSRLGYSIKDAQEMAKTSSIFASISPGMDIEQATDGLVSAMKAFNITADEALDGIASKINAIGNTQAVSNEGIVEFLTRSSAAMAEANSSLEETIALGTAISEITRDYSNAGQVMKTKNCLYVQKCA